MSFSFAQAEIREDNSSVNAYISQENLDRSDVLLQKVASPEVVYTVLATFAILMVIVTYFVIVAILFVVFLGAYM